jgi:hypothetical protein
LLNPLRQSQPREVIGYFEFKVDSLGHTCWLKKKLSST